MSGTPLLQLDAITKRYGGVRALVDGHLEAEPGEVHGLLGPNGSGKSTLNKVLAGSVAPDSGTIAIDGQVVTVTSPLAAHRLGIGAVYQQLSVINSLSVEQNLLLGREDQVAGFRRDHLGARRARQMLERLAPALGSGVRPGTRVADLSPGQQQLIEIGKVLLREPRILIFDEATASLHRDQVAVLFEIIDELRSAGVCMLFVSHRLDEIRQICDRATILRSGSTVATVTVAEADDAELVQLMIGRRGAEAADAASTDASVDTETTDGPATDTAEPDPAAIADVVPTDDQASAERLVVRDLSSDRLHEVSLTVRRGEVVGLGGLQGQGQSELLGAIFGSVKSTGQVHVDDTLLPRSRPTISARRGVALVPGDRNREGLLAQRPILENIAIVSLWRRATMVLSHARERRLALDMAARLQIKYGTLNDPVAGLSGGNAQKVVLAKWLLNEPVVILLDDPTKGVDVGAKAEFHTLIDELAAAGASVIVNSSEDRELVRLCDRVLVLHEGRIGTELSGDRLTEEQLVAAALGIGATEDQEAPA